jgi:outer membrane protein assembly factor BamB
VLDGDVSYLPEASSDLSTWVSGGGRFIPFGNPTDMGNGQREYHVRYYQSVDAVSEGRVMLRVRMESRYQAAIGEDIQPSVELRNGQARVTWTTSEPTVTVINYGTDGQASTRYEDYTLTTYHEVVINVEPGKSFTYTVIQTDEEGVETRSNTFTVSGLWDYSPPPVPDQSGFNSSADWSARADEILALPRVLDRGYCLDYQCGDGRLAYELARKSQIVVIGVEDTQAEVDAARAFLTDRGVYGSRVTVLLASDLANLPFPHDIFNLIVSQNQIATASDYASFKAAVEVYSIPNRGIVAGSDGGSIHADAPKPANADTGSWSMAYGNPGNTSASTEGFNGKTSMDDFELRWLGAPGAELSWDRQVAEQPPLAVNGRFYCQGRGRILALDSHNGSVLWTKELDDAQRFNLLRDAGDLTADDDAVWLSLRKECWKMDGDTGHLTVYPLIPGSRSDLEYCWNYICRVENHLLGSASVDAAFYKEHWGPSFWYVHETNGVTDQVVSDNLFSLNPDTGLENWHYEDGLILSVSICSGNGKVFFLETRDPASVASTNRRLSESAWKKDLHLVCLDLSTGSKLWDQAISPSGGTITVFLMYDSVTDKLVLSTTSDKDYLYCYNPSDGSLLWSKSHNFAKTDHGGKSQHPILKGGEVYFEPNVYDISTGNINRSDMPNRSGLSCSTLFGSKNLLFYRTGYSGEGLSMWPSSGGTTTGIDHVRGSCWLNYAPADGLFLVQEMSSGCSCAAWIHISQGWGPKEN